MAPPAQTASPDYPRQASPWLKGRSFEDWRDEFDRRGFLIFERVLSPDNVAAIRALTRVRAASSTECRWPLSSRRHGCERCH